MSSPFNPDVANAFFRAGEIEAWGRGIQRILDACRTGDAPEPEIRLEPNGLWLEFPFSPEYLAVIGEAEGQVAGETPQKTSGKTSGKIIEFIQKDAFVTIPELAEKIGVTERSVERNIQKLQEKCLIRRVGPAKGGHWEVIRKS